MDDFYYEENSKHVFLKCLFILFIFGLIIGSFIYYKNTNTLRLKKVTFELGDKLSTNVKDYILSGKNINEYKLYLDNVDETKVGTYIYKIRYNRHTKNGKLIIKDTTSPKITPNEITLKKGDKLNKEDLITVCEDLSTPCTVTLKNDNIDELLNNIGSYEVEYVVTDLYDNKTKGTTTVNVSDTEETSSILSNDLDYAFNSANNDKIEHIYFKKLDKAIDADSEEYENMIENIASTDFSELDTEVYKTELIVDYNKYGYVIGFQVLVTHNDGTTKLLSETENIEG